MVKKVEKVAVFQYDGEVYKDTDNLKIAVLRDLIAERLEEYDLRGSVIDRDDLDGLALHLAEKFPFIQADLDQSLVGTGIS